MKVPKPGSKKYKEIVERGCGLEKYYCWDYGCYEYDCGHDYEWICDNCPIVTEKYLKEEPCGNVKSVELNLSDFVLLGELVEE